MKKQIRFGLFLWVITLAGCAFPERTNLPHTSDLKETDSDAVVILGVDPTYQVDVEAMHVLSPVAFEQEEWGHLAFAIVPEHGYIVAKVPKLAEEERYVIFVILTQGMTKNEIYFTCDGADAPTFDIQPGSVTYLGNIHFKIEEEGKKLRITHDSTPDAARGFLEKNYPKLAGKMVVGEFTQMHIFGKPCVIARPHITFMVPIKVP